MRVFSMKHNRSHCGQHDGTSEQRSVEAKRPEYQHCRCRELHDGREIVKARGITPACVIGGNPGSDESIPIGPSEEKCGQQPGGNVSPINSRHEKSFLHNS